MEKKQKKEKIKVEGLEPERIAKIWLPILAPAIIEKLNK